MMREIGERTVSCSFSAKSELSRELSRAISRPQLLRSLFRAGPGGGVWGGWSGQGIKLGSKEVFIGCGTLKTLRWRPCLVPAVIHQRKAVPLDLTSTQGWGLFRN